MSLAPWTFNSGYAGSPASGKEGCHGSRASARDLGVAVKDLAGSDVAVDVHVRRVFLRTRLALYDEPTHILDVARSLHPKRPGALDFPAWLIGRRWCGPGLPDCPSCPLGEVCPRDVARAAIVDGT